MTETSLNDSIRFNISQVAKMIGVVPTTIRNWEKEGLFTAKRTSSNYRVYDFDDIELLKKIKQYSLDEGISISAIKHLLISGSDFTMGRLFDADKEESFKYSKKLLSNKWKDCREKLNHTLEEVSNHIGISPSYLSKIENGQANISIDILNKLADFYGESILYFFEDQNVESKLIQKGCGEKVDVALNGVTMESLIGVKSHAMTPMIFHVEPGCGSLTSHRHHGEEFIYILKGKIKVTINDNEPYTLKSGDSMYFKSYDYHNWCNIGEKNAQILWVHSNVEAK